jgi:hypothetical protein
MKKNNLPSKINSSTSMNFKWDDFTYKKKDFKAYRSYLSKKIVILNHTDTVFLKNPDGSVDFSKKMNFDDLKLDLIDNGFKISDNNFKSIINSGSIEKIDSLIIFFNQLKTNKWDKVDRIKDLVSAAKLKGEFDENLKLIKKWLCTTYGFAMRDIDPEMPEKVFSRVVFILCSEQRGFGKTEFFRKIGLSGAIEDATGIIGSEIYCEAQGELPKDDRNFSINLITKMIYLLDDINNQVVNSEGILRSIISQDYVTKRDLYKDHNKSLKKRATLAGTTNYGEILKKNGENRYMMFTVKEIMDFDKLNSINYFQLWSQIRQEIINKGDDAFFTKEDYNMIIKMSNDYIYISPLEQVLNNMFVFDENGKIGFSEIMKSLKEDYSIYAPTNSVGVLAPEGVNIIHKKNGKRFYKLQWRNLIDEGEEDDQDLPF